MHTSYDDLGPGLHVLREAEPLKRAGPMATNLRAELCATLDEADATLTERSGFPLVDTMTLSTLQVLARRLARAQRIAARTRDRAVAEVGNRLAGAGAGLAVHPTTIRDRAASVDVARVDLAAAERALADHAAVAAAADERAAAELAAAEAEAERIATGSAAARRRAGPSPRARRSRAIGLIVACLGLGLVLLAVGVTLWAALLPVLTASLWALRYLRVEEDGDRDEEGWQEASNLLSQVGASADVVFGERWANRSHDDGQLSLLTARRDRAQEKVRVAARAWHDLAGEDVDISELEEVVRRFDPQHEDARLLAGETVGVRTAEVVLHRFQQRWLAFWRELGLDAPAPEAGEEAVRDLAARVSRPIVLVGPATALGEDLARVAPAAPVVVLDGPSGEPDAVT